MNPYLLIILTAFLSLSALALETDNYISLGKELSDSKEVINNFLSDEIRAVLRDQKANDSCPALRLKIAKRFKSLGVRDNPIENYLIGHLPRDAFYPHTFEYVAESIYRDPFLPHIPDFGLSPNINVSGVYLGTDKLTHFVSTGYTYYLIYSAALSRYRDEEAAFLSAISYGIKDEQSFHGYWASGVFSYADLEANFQGLLFYRKLCTRYLSKTNSGAWDLSVLPDIGEYVSGDWDETFNRSYFVEANWKKVKPFILEYKTVPKRTYAHRKSFSQLYMEKLIREKRIPVPQSI